MAATGERFQIWLKIEDEDRLWRTSDCRNKLITAVHRKHEQRIGAPFRIVDTQKELSDYRGKITFFPRYFSED